MLPKRIAVVGSSTSEGNLDPQGGYVGLLRAWHVAKGDDHHVYNLGLAGDTTEGMFTRMPGELKPRNPDLVIINTGRSDIVREGSLDSPVHTELDDFRNNIKRLIIRAQPFGDVAFLSITPFDETRTCPFRTTTKFYTMSDATAYAQATKEVCVELDVHYVDVFNRWLSINYSGFLSADGLLINAQGHADMFIALRDSLEAYYGQLQQPSVQKQTAPPVNAQPQTEQQHPRPQQSLQPERTQK